ncbi:hypothetical protein JJV70_02020 [Streptomyces sp. JJ66]|uniref:hypothetical protein n=1 Tax=Streptomyces sp. JJ66 TaxID=2803843 RepID=UPI001C585E96|nr:hypothetical protein [Streptomyces sp. JJ66]MBW1600897.1 hypothetical protein [Streptomyces sp. JJ66]
MALPTVPMPDAEAVTIGVLAPLRDAGVTLGSQWPEHLAERLPVVAVSLGGGGTRLRAVTVDRTVDIDVLAADKGTAFDLAAEVSARLIAAQGTTQPGARIYSVTETSLVWLPDETTGIARYVLVMSLVLRPAAGT